MRMVDDKVWVGFQIGYLCVYDANSHQPLVQTWIRQGVPVLSLTSLPALGRMFVGMGNGSVLAFNNDIEPLLRTGGDRVSHDLKPVATYHEHGQVAATLLVIPRGSEEEITYELWVGQTNKSIAVLDAENLEPLAYLDNPEDHTPCPGYLIQLTYAHLTSNIPPEAFKKEVVGGKTLLVPPAWHEGTVIVYAALQHGRCITRWNGKKREIHECMDCRELLPEDDPSKIFL